MTEDEIRSHPAYKEGWDAYDPWFSNGGKWPVSYPRGHWPVCPYIAGNKQPPDKVKEGLWSAGANSAYGGGYRIESRCVPNCPSIPRRSPPILTSAPQHVQLDLF